MVCLPSEYYKKSEMPESALAQMVRCGKDVQVSYGWFLHNTLSTI